MARILIIDDDRSICNFYSDLLTEKGHVVESTTLLQEGVRICEQQEIDVVLLDVQLPDGNGLKFLPRIQKSKGQPEVIIITGEGDPDGAELAIKSGAWDYLAKPLLMDPTLFSIDRALLYHTEKQSTEDLASFDRQGIIGDSMAMVECLHLAARAAKSGLNTLITGETGTGKELFARAIHNNSIRSKESFIVVDCTALPKNLVESTLFGHEKGAFTGADSSQKGLVKLANLGTLFLDEVGELPLATQKSFLRVLQEKKYRTVGGKDEQESDFSLVSATNRNLDEMEKNGRFRKDLLFRLQTINIELPPLRERGNDIKLLSYHFVNRFCQKNNMPPKQFSNELLEALCLYDWPGNVRELLGVMENIISVSGNDSILYPDCLPTSIRAKIVKSSIISKNGSEELTGDSVRIVPTKELLPFKKYREEVMSEAEKSYMKDLMEATNWDIKQAGKVSKLSRARVYGLLKKHRISKED